MASPAAKLTTTALRSFLQRRYLEGIASSAAAVATASTSSTTTTASFPHDLVKPSATVDINNTDFVTHNSVDRGGHKLLNLVYVLNYKGAERIVSVEEALNKQQQGTAEATTDDIPSASPANKEDTANAPIVVLLGHKARGFGKGNWNGFGGKVDVGIDASITASAARELEEEVGLKLVPAGGSTLSSVCRHVGIMFYQYPAEHQPLTFEVHVYVVDGSNKSQCEGIPTESEEMNPIVWFEEKAIPLANMWADDPYWLPQLLEVVMRPAASSAPADDAPPATATNAAERSHIARNIDDAAFVGYVDFLTMSETRGGFVVRGKDAVASLVAQMGAADATAADPLSAFTNERCPIH